MKQQNCRRYVTYAFAAVNGEAPPPAYIVYGGLEPLRFTNIFPLWEQDETATRLALVVSETSLFQDALYLHACSIVTR